MVSLVNPLQASRYRQRHGVSGAKSDGGDAHMVDVVCTDSHQLRLAAVDSPRARAVKVVARTRKTMIRDSTRATQRLRHQLREHHSAVLEAFDELDTPDAVELLGRVLDLTRAAKLTRARRRNIADKIAPILAALHEEHLGHLPTLTAAYAADFDLGLDKPWGIDPPLADLGHIDDGALAMQPAEGGRGDVLAAGYGVHVAVGMGAQVQRSLHRLGHNAVRLTDLEVPQPETLVSDPTGGWRCTACDKSTRRITDPFTAA
jgi:hypothetical protein